MKQSKAILEHAGVIPKLRLAPKDEAGVARPNGPHRVKLLEDHVNNDIDKDTGKQIQVVKYIVEEDGEKKMYKVPVKNKAGTEVHYLVQHLSEVAEGEEIILEAKRRGPKMFIQVTKVGSTHVADVEEEEVDEEADVTE